MRLLLRDLQPGTKYRLQVRATDGAAFSNWSRLFDLDTVADIIPPEVPAWADTNAFVADGDTFIATWKPLDVEVNQNKDFARYEIELSDGNKTTVIHTTNTSYTLTFDRNRTIFGSPAAVVTARVRAVDLVGNMSNYSSILTATNPKPAAPANMTVTSLYDSIKIDWAEVSEWDLSGYKVQVSTTSATSGFADIYNGTNTSYTHETTQFLTNHWYRVYSVDKFGSVSDALVSSPVKPKSSFTVDTTPPPNPSGFSASIVNNANGIGARASLAWAQTLPNPNDLAGFRVRWRKVGDTNWSQTDFSSEDRAAVVELQAAYQNYEFQIRSYDWMGNNSAWSGIATATSPANSAPTQVGGLASVADRTSIRLTWGAVPDLDLKEYAVEMSTTSNFASGNITFKTGNALYLDIGGLTTSTTYYFRVRAIDQAGFTGAWSGTHTKATLAQLTPGDIGAPTTGQFDTAVKNYSVEYSVNTSETTAPTSGWSTSTPTRTPGSFIWTRTVVTYQNNTTSATNPALLTGNAGTPGSDGAPGAPGSEGVPGRGISSTTVTYQTGSSATTPPGGTWQNSPTATTTGQFLWTRTITSFTDGSNNSASPAYSVSAHGAAGAAGRGITGTAVTYQVGTSGTTAPGGTWLTTIPTTTTGQFLWTRTVTTYSAAPLTVEAFSVSAHGATGSQGVSVTAVTPYFAVVASGAAAPTQPTNQATPPSPWVTTEPNYAPNTELYRTDRISYSNSTYAYTTVTKVSAYTAAVTAIAAANGKNKIVFSTADASGTNYAAGDIWYKRDANNVVIASWEFTTSWQARTFGDGVLNSLNVGKLVSGDITSALIKVASTGAIQSTDYNATTGLGWKLNATGLDIRKGTIVADTIRSGNLGGPAGTNSAINLTAGTSLIVNGGYIKSNTNTGTTMATATTSGAGFYLGNDGLFIGTGGKVKANALESDTLTSTIITLGAGAEIKSKKYADTGGAEGFSISDSGLIIKSGEIEAKAIKLQAGNQNLMPPEYADFEYPASFYPGKWVATNGFISIATNSKKFGGQSLNAWWGERSDDFEIRLAEVAKPFNIQLEAGKEYIISAYAWNTGDTPTDLKMFLTLNNGAEVNLGATAYPNPLTKSVDGASASRIWGVTGVLPAGIHSAHLGFRSTTRTPFAGFSIDGIQIEERVSASTAPSPWTAPTSTTINAYGIKTGSLQSNAPALDENGNAIDGVPAWSINTQGGAVLGDVLIRGSVTMGVSGEWGISKMKSYNYVPGSTGWQIKSNGVAEFQQLAANSVRAEALKTGMMNADIIIGSSISSIDTATLSVVRKQRINNIATLFTEMSHGREVDDLIRVRMDQSSITDTSFDSAATEQFVVTAVTSDSISYQNVGPNVGLTSHAGIVDVEGKRVSMTPAGISLSKGAMPSVVLPTKSGETALFTGKVEASGLLVKNGMTISGDDNSVNSGGIVTLASQFDAGAATVTANQEEFFDTSVIDRGEWNANMDLNNFRYRYRGMAYVPSTGYYYSAVNFSSGLNKKSYIVWYDAAGSVKGFKQTGFDKIGGLTFLNNNFYVLGKIGISWEGAWGVAVYSGKGVNEDFSAAATSTWRYELFSQYGVTASEWVQDVEITRMMVGNEMRNFIAIPQESMPAIGNDGTNLLIARGGILKGTDVANTQNPQFSGNGLAKFSPTGSLISFNAVATKTHPTMPPGALNGGMHTVMRGNFDFGAERTLIGQYGRINLYNRQVQINTDGTINYIEDGAGGVKSFSGTLSASNNDIANEGFAARAINTVDRNSIYGMAWNGTNFVGVTANGILVNYTDYAKNTTSDAKVRVSYAVSQNKHFTNAVWTKSNEAVVLTVANHGLGVGDFIYLSSASGGFSGFFDIESVTSGTITMRANAPATTANGGSDAIVSTRFETQPGPEFALSIPPRSKAMIRTTPISAAAAQRGVDRINWYISKKDASGNYLPYTKYESGNSAPTLFLGTASSDITSWTNYGFPPAAAAAIKTSDGYLIGDGAGNMRMRSMDASRIGGFTPVRIVRRTAPVALTSNQWTGITWNAERFDSQTQYVSVASPGGRLQVKSSGWFQIILNVEFGQNSTGRRIVAVTRNGGVGGNLSGPNVNNTLAYAEAGVGAGGYSTANVTAIGFFNAGEHIDPHLFTSHTTGSVTYGDAAGRTQMAVIRLPFGNTQDGS